MAESIDCPRQISQTDHLYFLERKEQMIEQIEKELKQGVKFTSLYEKVCAWRYQVAKECRQPGYSLFGCRRQGAKDDLFTNARVVHAHHLLEKLRSFVEKGELRHSLFRHNYPYPLFQVFPIYAEIDRQRILLTEIVGTVRGAALHHPELQTYFGDQEGEIIWAHMSAQNLLLLEQHLDQLYTQALVAKDKDLIGAIGRFHWWFIQSMPCYRGSAAIGEVLVAALWRARGCHAILRERAAVDLEALSCPDVEEFIARYHEFYTSIVGV